MFYLKKQYAANHAKVISTGTMSTEPSFLTSFRTTQRQGRRVGAVNVHDFRVIPRDVRSAFDTVNHKALILKPKVVGIGR